LYEIGVVDNQTMYKKFELKLSRKKAASKGR